MKKPRWLVIYKDWEYGLHAEWAIAPTAHGAIRLVVGTNYDKEEAYVVEEGNIETYTVRPSLEIS